MIGDLNLESELEWCIKASNPNLDENLEKKL